LAATGTNVGLLSGTPFDLIIGGAPDYLTASSSRRNLTGWSPSWTEVAPLIGVNSDKVDTKED